MSGRIGVDIIPHPQSQAALKKIEDLRRTGYAATHTQAQLLRGPGGVGKSVLVQRYAAKYPAQQTPDGWIRPVILATAGKGLTKPLAEALLGELNDSRPSRGTENDMMARAKQHLIAQKTQLIIFDEVQDAMRGDPYDAADFFKRVLNWSTHDDIHLHGYDIEKPVEKGKPARFDFTADIEGIFEMESHVAEDAGKDPLVGKLTVEPS